MLSSCLILAPYHAKHPEAEKNPHKQQTSLMKSPEDTNIPCKCFLFKWTILEGEQQSSIKMHVVIILYRDLNTVTQSGKMGLMGAWVAQLVKCLPLAQVMIPESWSSPASGSLLRRETASPFPSVPLPSHSLSQINKILKKKKTIEVMCHSHNITLRGLSGLPPLHHYYLFIRALFHIFQLESLAPIQTRSKDCSLVAEANVPIMLPWPLSWQ